jgi:hypothetical protein
MKTERKFLYVVYIVCAAYSFIVVFIHVKRWPVKLIGM